MKNLCSSAPLRLKKYPAYKDSGIEWLKEIPHHWTEKRLKNTATVRVSSVDKKTVEGQVSIRLCNYVDVYYNDLITQDIEFMEATATSQQIEKFALREGDVLITKDSETSDDIAVPSLVVSNLEGVVCGYHLALIRPNRSTMFGRYLSRALSAVGIRDQFHNCATGVTRFGLAVNDITDANILVPPLFEQKTIASFLDRKTAEIDTLIAKKRRMIELLQEKRTAVISHAVTKGLDPNAPMKDSGVEWLGKVPRHWEVLPFTKYVIEKSDYRGATPEKVTDGIFLVTARNVRMGFIDYEASQEFVRHADYDAIMRRGLPKKGDILFTTEAPLGNVALVDREDVALAQRIIRFRMNSRRLLSQFTLFAMMSGYFQSQLDSLSTGSTAEGLKASKLTHLWLVVPPLPEQNSIADYIERETSKINCMIEKVETVIDKLLEYRTALISAAVTGKIDVREEVRA